jgi:two-component system, NtrC family, response regulator AtoC
MNQSSINTNKHAETIQSVYKDIDFNLNVVKLILGNDRISFSDKAKEKIAQFYLSQNFESGQHVPLEVIIENAARRSKGHLIEAEHIFVNSDQVDYLPIPTGLKLEDLERKYILQTLYFVQQNRTKAADILGISIRTLRNKINQYKMEGYL